MKGINYDDPRERVDLNSKVVRYGKSVTQIDELGATTTTSITAIDEQTFYKIYLQLNNVIKWKRTPNGMIDMSLSDTPIELLSHLMMKDENFTLLYRSKDNKLTEMGEELGKTSQSVYTSISKLRKAEYIVKNEDNLFVPNDELRQLMRKVKTQIKENGHVTFDFLFKFCVK